MDSTKPQPELPAALLKQQLIQQGQSLRNQLHQTRQQAEQAMQQPKSVLKEWLPTVTDVALEMLQSKAGNPALAANAARLRSILPVVTELVSRTANNPRLKPALRTAALVVVAGAAAGLAARAAIHYRSRSRIASDRDSDFSLLR